MTSVHSTVPSEGNGRKEKANPILFIIMDIVLTLKGSQRHSDAPTSHFKDCCSKTIFSLKIINGTKQEITKPLFIFTPKLTRN